MGIISQRQTSKDQLRDKLHTQGNNTMLTTDQSRVNAALTQGQTIEEADFTDQEAEFEGGLASYTGGLSDDEFDNEEEFETEASEDDEEDEEEFDSEDEEDDEDDDYVDDEDDEDLEDEDDEDEDGDDLVAALLHDSQQAMADIFPDLEEISGDDLVAAGGLDGLLGMATERTTQTVNITSKVLVTVDLSEPEMFDRFKAKDLRNAQVTYNNETVNMFRPLHRKLNGLYVPLLNDLMDYSQALAQSPVTLLAENDDIEQTTSFLSEAISRAANSIVSSTFENTSDGEFNPNIPLLVSESKMADRIAELEVLDDEVGLTDEEREEYTQLIETIDTDCTSICLDDMIRVTTYVSNVGYSDDVAREASIITHIAMRFPSVLHKSIIEAQKEENRVDPYESILSIQKVLSKFAETRPDVSVRLGVTMNSAYGMSNKHGRKLTADMLDNGYEVYSFADVVSGSTPLNEAAYQDSINEGIDIAKSVFSFDRADVVLVSTEIETESDEDGEE